MGKQVEPRLGSALVTYPTHSKQTPEAGIDWDVEKPARLAPG